MIFCFAVLCAKNLAKKDFFRKYLHCAYFHVRESDSECDDDTMCFCKDLFVCRCQMQSCELICISVTVAVQFCGRTMHTHHAVRAGRLTVDLR